MNVLHITGTKGKGSTSAFVSSLLTRLAPSAKVGLYTSPHMVAVRERIRINGEPIPENMFARYFWEVWDKLEADQKVGRSPLFRSARRSLTSSHSVRPARRPCHSGKAGILPLPHHHGHACLPARAGEPTS